ncbi:MAG TPA: 2Fe-2S iron-sulfur cluster-binding protein, partial [Burkholderiaceae bacterium]
RQPVCGMGVCGECRVTVDGRAHRLGCQTACAPGMEILTDG